MRSSSGGAERSAAHPGAPFTPAAAIDCGKRARLHAAQARQRADHRLCVPSSRAEPASARNSRWRENHMTIIKAR